VSKVGLDALTPAEKAQLPELVLEDAVHRAYFDAATEGHELPGAGKDAFYAAQVVWDETMADNASRWIAGGEGRRIVILAGVGHCHERAIPARMKRRGVPNAISIRAIIDDGKGAVAEALAAPEGDYLVVMEIPSHR
jgi:uncharacterized iron-regulated protein